MNKFLTICTILIFFFNSSFADNLNPTNEWLKQQTVNSLTQEYGYTLKFVSGDRQFTSYILEKNKNTTKENKKNIIVTCTLRNVGAVGGIYCFLP